MTDTTPAAATTPINPLLQKTTMPGEIVRLPSQGLLYTNVLGDHVTDGEVHVYPMTAMDEIVIKSPDLLFSGDAIRQVFQRCIPDVIDVDGLFAKDIDFLMLVLRKVSYGSEYDVKHTHTCEGAKSHEYTCMIGEAISAAVGLDPTTLDQSYTTTLENNQVVKFTPMKFRDVVKIMQTTDSDTSPEKQQDDLFDAMIALITDVDGTTDRDMIMEWLVQLPIQMVKQLMSKVEVVSDWGPSYQFNKECKDCGESFSLNVPMNPLNFFT
jgi:hypothetical protein